MPAHAQYGTTPIKHVIVIFQENRTPDNLFQGLCTANGGVPGCNASGAGGNLRHRSTYVDADGQTVPLTPVGLATNFDLDHSHGGPKLNGTISGWNFEYHEPGNQRQTRSQRSRRLWSQHLWLRGSGQQLFSVHVRL